MSNRTYWFAKTLDVVDEPLVHALISYRMAEDRTRVDHIESGISPNLVSSKTDDGKHMPILDLDYSHFFVQSSTDSHHHLYLNTVMPTWKWVILMTALWISGVVEKEFFWWSLRRGGNFVRVPEVRKDVDSESSPHTFGYFFRKKD